MTAAGAAEPDPRDLAAWRLHLGHDVDPSGLLAALGAGSLPECFHATAVAAPDRPAIDIDGDARTHGELDRAAACIGAQLRERGIAVGSTLLVSGPSSIEMLEVYLGALRAGATVVLANPGYTGPELEHLVRNSEAALAVAAGTSLDLLRELAERVEGMHDVLDMSALAAVEGGGSAPAPIDPARPAVLAYTSGTTGRPKAVPLTHANLLASIRGAMLAWRWTSDDVLVHCLPLFHQHGLGGVHATLLAGSRAVIVGGFDAERLGATIRAVGATVLFAVPAIYERLVDEGTGAGLDGPRVLVSGSAPLSPGLAARVGELAGQVPLERYGTTESGLDVSNPYAGPRRPGTVGLPLPGVELRVVDRDGRPLAPGEAGEIVVRGPQVFAGYRGDPEATAEAFLGGGWFRTGDLGAIDPGDGYLAITGRAKDLIISGGMNVYPREVELALEEHDAVARAAVVGVPSERWGEEVVAAVVGAGESRVTPDAVLAFARGRLAPHKRPKRVVVVDALPVNAMGKIVTAEVAELVVRGP